MDSSDSGSSSDSDTTIPDLEEVTDHASGARPQGTIAIHSPNVRHVTLDIISWNGSQRASADIANALRSFEIPPIAAEPSHDLRPIGYLEHPETRHRQPLYNAEHTLLPSDVERDILEAVSAYKAAMTDIIEPEVLCEDPPYDMRLGQQVDYKYHEVRVRSAELHRAIGLAKAAIFEIQEFSASHELRRADHAATLQRLYKEMHNACNAVRNRETAMYASVCALLDPSVKVDGAPVLVDLHHRYHHHDLSAELIPEINEMIDRTRVALDDFRFQVEKDIERYSKAASAREGLLESLIGIRVADAYKPVPQKKAEVKGKFEAWLESLKASVLAGMVASSVIRTQEEDTSDYRMRLELELTSTHFMELALDDTAPYLTETIELKPPLAHSVAKRALFQLAVQESTKVPTLPVDAPHPPHFRVVREVDGDVVTVRVIRLGPRVMCTGFFYVSSTATAPPLVHVGYCERQEAVLDQALGYQTTDQSGSTMCVLSSDYDGLDYCDQESQDTTDLSDSDMSVDDTSAVTATTIRMGGLRATNPHQVEAVGYVIVSGMIVPGSERPETIYVHDGAMAAVTEILEREVSHVVHHAHDEATERNVYDYIGRNALPALMPVHGAESRQTVFYPGPTMTKFINDKPVHDSGMSYNDASCQIQEGDLKQYAPIVAPRCRSVFSEAHAAGRQPGAAPWKFDNSLNPLNYFTMMDEYPFTILYGQMHIADRIYRPPSTMGIVGCRRHAIQAAEARFKASNPNTTAYEHLSAAMRSPSRWDMLQVDTTKFSRNVTNTVFTQNFQRSVE